MAIEELYKKHEETVCKDCTLKECTGAHITIDKKVKCERCLWYV